ncbi:MAG: DUF1631 family protein [Ectothiorhodospiraceae bacterium]|nr:DUF1631 family protein [Ectothiorhodospiraceae bacterium]
MTAERRTYHRHAVTWDAEVSGDGYGPLAFEIQDVCEGGVFLSPSTRAAAQGLRQRHLRDAWLSISIRDPVTSRRRSARARLVRDAGDGFGVAFEHPQQDLINALLTVAESDLSAERQPVANTAARTQTSNDQRRRYLGLLQGCGELITDYLRDRLETFLLQAEGALLAAADRTTSPTDQAAYFGGIKLLKNHRRHFGSDIVTEVLQHWGSLGHFSIEEERGQQEEGELALVDEGEFEDWLLRSEAVTRAETRAIRALRLLQRRLAHAVGKPIDERSNPLSPTALSHLLAHRLRTFRPDPRCKEVLYPAFGKTVLNQLSVLYDGINARLRENGVLPDLENEKLRVAKVQSSPAAARRQRSDQPAASNEEQAGNALLDATESSPSNTTQGLGSLYRTVRELFRSGRSRPDSGVPEPQQVGAPAPPDLVLEAVGRLGSATPLQPGQSLSEQLAAQLAGLRPGQPMHLAGEQRETVDLMDQWFSELRPEESDEAGFFRNWSRQIMPLALQEEMRHGHFLKNRDLPLHRLIDALDRATESLATLSGGEREQLEATFSPAIRRALETYRDDPSYIEEATGLLEQSANKARRIQEAGMERIRQSCEGSQRLDQARQEVERALARRLEGKQVPEPVLDLLDQGWRNRLVLLELRRDKDPGEWDNSVKALDMLLRGIGSPTMPRQPLKEPNKLLFYIEQALQRGNVPTDRAGQLTRQLGQWLKRPTDSDEHPPCRLYKGEQVTALADAADDLPQEWLGQAKLLELGDWVYFRDEAGQRQPLRLAWASRRRDRFVFVNRAGQKTAELTLGELARRLGEKEADADSDLNAPATERRWQDMLVKMNKQLTHEANHDPLTGLLNRHAMERRVRHLLQRPASERHQHVLLQLALDDFKVVNHKLGHGGGDQVLKQLASLLKERSGKRGLVARMGGDEFAVLLVRSSGDTGARFATELLNALQGRKFSAQNQSVRITGSIGVVPFSRETHTMEDLLRDADNACFAAKEAGGNRVHVYRPGDAEMAELRKSMDQATRVDQALDAGLISLRCQRIDPLQQSGWPPMYEVLMAIAGDDRGAMRPDQFIPSAERFGRMPALDRWVISEVLRWMSNNPTRLHDVDALTINLSGQTLNDVGFMDYLRAQFKRFRVTPQRVCFEVTETAAVANLALAADMIRALKHMGCRFALDDFGSGLSSYSYLKNLPADYLKIDGEFIRDLDRDGSDDAMVKSIHELSHHLGKLTVAEFVETETVRNRLRGIGLDYAQGYGIDMPVPLDQLGNR